MYNLSLFRTWLTNGFCELTLDVNVVVSVMVDECGNQWECSSLFGRRPFLHFIIGGGFNRLVMARRLCEGSHVMVGASVALCF